MSNHYMRQVDHDYQYILIGKTVQVLTSEANYSQVYRHDGQTEEEAIAEYWHILMKRRQGKNIFECCGIDQEDVSEHVRQWEAKIW